MLRVCPGERGAPPKTTSKHHERRTRTTGAPLVLLGANFAEDNRQAAQSVGLP